MKPSGARTSPSTLTVERVLVALVLLTALGIGFAGIKKNLPYTPESDESIFVVRAVDMATTGDLNPHWFGNPGSTVIYPLAAAYSAWHAVTDGGDIIPPDSDIRANYNADRDDYYYIGRSLTILYFVGTVLLTFLVGKRAFNAAVGLAGALLVSVSLPFIQHAQIVRTDSAGAFFGMLGLLFILWVYERPTTTNRLLAGGAIGLAVSSRYFLVTLAPVLAAAELLVLLRKRSATPSKIGIRDLVLPFIGPLAAFAAFVITTPYFFPDFDTARENIRTEARSTHLGADGLSRPGNFIWYFTYAIPDALTPPVAVVALAGAALALARRHLPLLLCLAYGLVFVAATSYSSLHWQRWIIPVLPIVTILAAYAVHEAVAYARERWRLPSSAAAPAIASIVAFLLIWPGVSSALHDIRDARPSTRLLAREWIVDNLPENSRIAGEWYTAPLSGTHFQYSETFSLFGDRSVDDFYNQGVRYIVSSSGIYDRYYAEPDRYAEIISRYDALFRQELLQEFSPSDTRGGPVVRVYEIAPDQPVAVTDTAAR
jgi:hypothetical protein